MPRYTRDDITIRSEKDVPLSRAELDNNFLSVRQAMEDLESHISTLALHTADIAALQTNLTSLDTSVNALINSIDARLTSTETLSIRNDNRIDAFYAGQADPQPPAAPSLNILPSQTDVSETDETSQQSVQFTITTTDMYSTENITWSISGTNIDLDDFQSISIDGVALDPISLSGTIPNAQLSHIVTVVVARDETEEVGNSETFTFTVNDIRGSGAQTRNVIINDTSLNSASYTVAYAGPPASLFEYLSTLAPNTGSMWMENFDVSELQITTTERDQIIASAQTEDYAPLVNLGLTIPEIDQLVVDTVDAIIPVMNQITSNFFGTGSLVLLEDGVYMLGSYTTEANGDAQFIGANSRKYIRGQNRLTPDPARFTGVEYKETYVVADLRAAAETEVDSYIAGLTLSEADAATLKTTVMALVDLILPIATATAEAMSTTVDIYDYRKLTPNS